MASTDAVGSPRTGSAPSKARRLGLVLLISGACAIPQLGHGSKPNTKIWLPKSGRSSRSVLGRLWPSDGDPPPLIGTGGVIPSNRKLGYVRPARAGGWLASCNKITGPGDRPRRSTYWPTFAYIHICVLTSFRQKLSTALPLESVKTDTYRLKDQNWCALNHKVAALLNHKVANSNLGDFDSATSRRLSKRRRRP